MGSPVIVSPGLKQSIDQALAQVKPGQKGRAGAAITITGVEFQVGYKPAPKLDVGAYVSKAWKGGGWTGGARIGFDF